MKLAISAKPPSPKPQAAKIPAGARELWIDHLSDIRRHGESMRSHAAAGEAAKTGYRLREAALGHRDRPAPALYRVCSTVAGTDCVHDLRLTMPWRRSGAAGPHCTESVVRTLSATLGQHDSRGDKRVAGREWGTCRPVHGARNRA